MMRKIILVVVMMVSSAVVAQEAFTIAWWNVENLFDTRDDPATSDDEFTPEGERHWSTQRFNAKRDGIYKTLLMIDSPDVVGLAEVENAYVLRELCFGTPLSKAGYNFVHYDSPDRRGIDCALLYRKERFRVTDSRAVSLSDSAANYFTRDILLVEGVTPAGDTLCLLVNHWPSKLGGDEAETRRMAAATTLRRLMDSLSLAHPAAAVVAMGDFNSTADEPPIAEGMGFGDLCRNADGIQNLDCDLPRDAGSHKYQGEWRYIDALFLRTDRHWSVMETQLLQLQHLLVRERGKLGLRPKRTYLGIRYEGGLSDHLPLLLKLKHYTQQ